MRRLLLAAAGLCALAGGALALSGGGFSILGLTFNAGGWSVFPSGGGFEAASSIAAGQVTRMQGGGFTVTPGPGSGTSTARNLGAAYAYPVPFKPSLGHSEIVFAELTPRATIKVFTLSGELVKTLTKEGASSQLVWRPVANEAGQGLASGVYFYVIEAPEGHKKTGKLMIVK